MACCGRSKNKNTIDIPKEQQKIVDAVRQQNLTNQSNNTGIKSNRSRPGFLTKECQKCGTKTSFNICPICSERV